MDQVNIQEVIDAFSECPENYFYSFGGEFYEWSHDEYGSGQRYLPDIYAKYNDLPIGWVQSIEIIGTTAVIGHMALNPDLTGHHLGTSLAHALGRKFSAHFGSTTIRFDERSIEGKMEMYQAFFEHIGATLVPDRNFVWDWNFNENDIAF